MSLNSRYSLILRMQALVEIIERGILGAYIPRIGKTDADGFNVPEDVLRATASAPLAPTLNRFQMEDWHFEPDAFLSRMELVLAPDIRMDIGNMF